LSDEAEQLSLNWSIGQFRRNPIWKGIGRGTVE